MASSGQAGFGMVRHGGTRHSVVRSVWARFRTVEFGATRHGQAHFGTVRSAESGFGKASYGIF
jgi:hypothetical protein